MRTFSRAQHVVSTIIYWCPRTSSAGGGCGASRGEPLAGQALQPAHDPYGHIGTLPRSSGMPSPREFSSSCIELWYPDAGAAPLSPVAAGNQVLLLTAAFARFVKWQLSPNGPDNVSTATSHGIDQPTFSHPRRPSERTIAHIGAGPLTDLGAVHRDFAFVPTKRTSSVSRTASESVTRGHEHRAAVEVHHLVNGQASISEGQLS
jgi:hypothetical protein